ncbi:hypothetical protein DFQ26_004627 [Actinomortierella ambigua]|nr:hypothetical protein DFQ26_004627 [Actinomortierella ambigua]
MESTVKAAATVQNNILLVQYSPTGKNVGDLYAFVLSETTKPLPFQIQRQTDMQGSKRPVASMSLITVTTSAFTDSKSPTGGVETDDTVPQLLTQSPTDQNASKSVAVTPAPPFRDIVLAVNDDNLSAQLWHLKAPGRAVPPPDSPTPSPQPTGGGPGAGTGSGKSGDPSAPLWTAAALPQSLYLNAKSVSVGNIHPRGLKEVGIIALSHGNDSDDKFRLLKLVYRRLSAAAGDATSPDTQEAAPSPPSSSPPAGGDDSNGSNPGVAQSYEWVQTGNETALHDSSNNVDFAVTPPQPGITFHVTPISNTSRSEAGFSYALLGKSLPDSATWDAMFVHEPNRDYYHEKKNDAATAAACFTSIPNALVGIVGHEVYVNKLHLPNNATFEIINSKTSTPSYTRPVVACTSTKDYIIAIVPDSRADSPPEVHFFGLKTKSWAKAQLVEAPPGTFNDAPPPSPGGPNKGGPGGEGPNNPNNEGDSSTKEMASIAVIIGGVIGGAKDEPLEEEEP